LHESNSISVWIKIKALKFVSRYVLISLPISPRMKNQEPISEAPRGVDADVEGVRGVGRPSGRTCHKASFSVNTETFLDARVAALAMGISLSSAISDLLAVWLRSDAITPQARIAIEKSHDIREAKKIEEALEEAEGAK
jgi:hypothetical protein